MPGRVSQHSQASAIARIATSTPDAALFRDHLLEISDSAAFKGSRRSLEFLRHIVEKALAGHFEELKERSLGVELFRRPASYDTGADAIVRVTASDVRRRLHQYYSEAGARSELRIELPSGSYIPEFRHIAKLEPLISDSPPSPVAVDVASEVIPKAAPRTSRFPAPAIYVALALCLALGIWMWKKYTPAESSEAKRFLPWSVLLGNDRDLRVVFCDPDISMAQGLLNFRLSVSDYANQRYLPEGVEKNPEAIRIVRTLRGVNVASVDATTALSIAYLAKLPSHRIKTHTARSLHILDFKTEDNFVLLGSPQSNPWFELFQDQLDFRFEYDKTSGQEIIRNHRMQSGEAAMYVPTAKGWGTGQAYAIVALVTNANQKGHVLLLAGSNAEATEAAGKFVTNSEAIAGTLQKHGIDPAGPEKTFEVLLRVTTMAGSPDKFDVIACHRLSGG